MDRWRVGPGTSSAIALVAIGVSIQTGTEPPWELFGYLFYFLAGVGLLWTFWPRVGPALQRPIRWRLPFFFAPSTEPQQENGRVSKIVDLEDALDRNQRQVQELAARNRELQKELELYEPVIFSDQQSMLDAGLGYDAVLRDR